MSRKIKQYRYYGEGNNKNQPSEISKETLVSGKVFKNFPILQLGIQTLPGTKFYLNKSVEPIIIGFTGIYELNLENQAEITYINFEQTSIENISINPNGYLIVDILYEEEVEV